MAIPIFIIHWGNSNYLKYCIHQAKYYNPDSEIILIGNRKNNKYHFVRHYHTSGYSFNANLFLKTYVHLNMTIPSWYIKLWLKRWFVLRDFMKVHDYGNQFLYIDSDVLLFCNVTKEMEKFKDYSMTISDRAPSIAFFNGVKTLDDLCNFFISMYAERDNLKILEYLYEHHKLNNHQGGIDDMTIISEYKKRHPGEVGDNSTIIDGSTFESNMDAAEEYEYNKRKKIKKIYWKNGLPYGKHLPDGNLIKFNALHFPGGSKAALHQHYTGKDMHIQKVVSAVHYHFIVPWHYLRGLSTRFRLNF